MIETVIVTIIGIGTADTIGTVIIATGTVGITTTMIGVIMIIAIAIGTVVRTVTTSP